MGTIQVDSELKEQLGEILMNFAGLEVHLTLFIWCLHGEDARAGQRISQMRAKADMGFEFISQDFDLKKLRMERKFIGDTVANVMLYMHHAAENDPGFLECLEHGEAKVHWMPYKED